MTLAHVAELLQSGEDTVQALAEKGELPGRRIGAEWRFARSAVLDWLAGGERKE
jgi:excisionase family DNA binding protein